MKILAALGFAGCVFLIPVIFTSTATCQNSPPPHVVIPNPTPRPNDLEQQYGDDSKDGKKQRDVLIQNQLRAREIWLESNQILLLAQQLQQDVPGTKSMTANAAKVGQIEKLARSVQEKMKVQ
jgi:hypothetical protein